MILRQYVEDEYLITEYDDGTTVKVVNSQPPPRPLPLPLLNITSISSAPDAIASDLSEVTVKVGATVTAIAQITDGANVLPVNAAFRMPVTASDGREIVALAQFVDGVAEIAIPFEASGIWSVTEATINRALPPEQQMTFAGITIYVVV